MIDWYAGAGVRELIVNDRVRDWPSSIHRSEIIAIDSHVALFWSWTTPAAIFLLSQPHCRSIDVDAEINISIRADTSRGNGQQTSEWTWGVHDGSDPYSWCWVYGATDGFVLAYCLSLIPRQVIISGPKSRLSPTNFKTWRFSWHIGEPSKESTFTDCASALANP